MSDNDQAIVVAGPSAVLPFDYGEDAGVGYENQTSQDYTIPFVKLLQSKSPEVEDEDNPARAGDFINTVTGEIYTREDGFLFLACLTEHKFAKWMPRDEGGGFRGHLAINDPVVLEAAAKAKRLGRYEVDEEVETPTGRTKIVPMTLRETFYVYGVLCHEDGYILSAGVALAFWGTKIRPYKTWQTRMRELAKAPMFAHLTRFTSEQRENSSGTFYVPKITTADPRGVRESLVRPDDDRFLAAKKLHASIREGQAKVDFESQEEGGTSAGGGEGDVPF